MRIIMDLAYYAVAIAFYKIIYLHTPNLGGWNESQMMIFVAGYLIVDALNMTIFTNNMWFLPQLINKGDLDYYLVRPVSSLFFVSLRDFAANSFINLLFALGILGWAIGNYHPVPGIGSILLYLLFLLNGTVIFYTLNTMANLLTFWTHSPRGFGELIWTLNKFGERPDSIFRGWLRKVLVFVLPFAVIASFPARILLDGFDWKIVFHMFGITALFLVLLNVVWRLGLRSYSSASS
jgi:ABC-2 type transport system permease protein